MEAIFSSKIYKASDRQDKIKAALLNPANGQLVQQLRKYLDDEYIDEKYLGGSPGGESKEDAEAVDEEIQPSDYSESRAGHVGGHSGGGSGSPSQGFDFSDEPFSETSEDGGESSSSESDVASDVAESAEVTSSEDTDMIIKDLDSMKGLLDSREDTTGVARILVNDDELWIHYKDNINLNNVMESVISVINSAGYNNLQFNRLARTENAIVFSINHSSAYLESVSEELPDE